MRLRILLSVFPRQSPSPAILLEMSSDADWLWLAPDFFMFSSWKFQKKETSATFPNDHFGALTCSAQLRASLLPSTKASTVAASLGEVKMS